MSNKKRPPARTPEARENQLISMAIDLVEKQLLDGSASSQILTHFLRLATAKEKLQNEKLKSDLRVAEAKIKAIENQDEIKVLYEQALDAMKRYGGTAQYDCENDLGDGIY